MPIHDWTRVDAGIFHAFHHEWITDLSRALNRGLLPSDYYALPEQNHVCPEPNPYANKAKAVTVRHSSDHRVVAVVEIVSPGNKNNRHGLRAFRQGRGIAARRRSPAGGRSLSARAARPAGHPPADLGRAGG
jgi:hypothetical protein